MKYTKEQYIDFLSYVENGRGFIDDNVFFKEHQEIAKHLLQLQLPKQEITKKTKHKLNGLISNVEEHDYCPTCDKMFYDQEWEDEINYCSNCGQAIKWSDGEKNER